MLKNIYAALPLELVNYAHGYFTIKFIEIVQDHACAIDYAIGLIVTKVLQSYVLQTIVICNITED